MKQGKSILHFSLDQGLLKKKRNIVVGPDKELKKSVLFWLHDSPHGGHSRRVKALFCVEKNDNLYFYLCQELLDMSS